MRTSRGFSLFMVVTAAVMFSLGLLNLVTDAQRQLMTTLVSKDLIN